MSLCREEMNNMKYIVELEKGVWIASWDGDPGRTVVKQHAKIFENIDAARIALDGAKEYRDFLGQIDLIEIEK